MGKLVRFWIMCWLGLLVALAIAEAIMANFWESAPLVIPLSFLMLGLALFIIPFIVTWKWFTAREE